MVTFQHGQKHLVEKGTEDHRRDGVQAVGRELMLT